MGSSGWWSRTRPWFIEVEVVPALIVLVLAAVLATSPASAQPRPGETPAAPPATLPAIAVAALDRASAAYDYGDMTQVVHSTRLIVDGALVATPGQRLEALRLLGIGLYLTGRPTGAESYFLELLRSSRRARLDPTTTRPEVVAFFEDIRRRHAAEIQDAARVRSRRSMVWNFFAPIGQFKNGDSARGVVVLGLEVASLATAVTTRLVLDSWRAEHDEFPGHTEVARTLRTLNQVSVGVLAATWVIGVTDAFLRSDHEPDSPEPRLSFHLLPGGAAFSARF
jgi:hypothetical protein